MIELLRNYCATIASLPATPYTTTTTTQRVRKENLQCETLAPSTPTVDMEMLEKTSKTISTIAILWPVKAIFETRATTVEVDTFISPDLSYVKTLFSEQLS